MSASTGVPPQNSDAERGAIGAMLVSEPAVDRVIVDVGLEAVDFYQDRHRVIFGAIVDLHAKECPVDEITVADALERAKKLDEAGGRHYISELAANVPAAGNAKHYGEIVQQHAAMYRLLQAAQAVVTAVNERNGDTAAELAQRAAAAIEDANVKGRVASIRTADLKRVRPIHWAWTGRLLLGYLNLLLGAEGVGKSTLAAWLMAQLTNGALPGDLEGRAARVLILGDEDSFDSVWTPRLHAAGADLAMVDVLEDEFDLGVGAAPLRKIVERGGYRVLFFDQLLDNLGLDVDDWRQIDIRNRLRPLRRVARDLDVLALGALHPNKGQKSNFRDLVSGTVAFNALSRSSLLLAQHPEDEDRRVLIRGKGNLSAPPPSFEFSIEGRELEINGHSFSLPVVARYEDGDLGIDDVIKPIRDAPVLDDLVERIDAIGTGTPQKRSEIAAAVGRPADDRSVGRALKQLEAGQRWAKTGRGTWQKLLAFGIGTSSDVPIANKANGGVAA